LSKKTLIIIPAYNEEGSIGAVVDSIRKHTVEADILVVNDGSQDRTARQARESGACTPGAGERGHGYEPAL
jgi:glycosyltransferase involved in cell wall biosynthesis